MYYSQIGQDKFVNEFLNKKNGVFVDIGAHDGRSGSNSLFFEESMGWSGICIEPSKDEFMMLSSFRKSINLNVCVSDYDGESDFMSISGYSNMLSGLTNHYDQRQISRIYNEVKNYGGETTIVKMPVRRLQSILDEYNILEIDYCSIDTEGSEFNIVKSIDFQKTDIRIFSIENNFQTTDIKDYLYQFGYELHCKLQWDDIFIKSSIKV